MGSSEFVADHDDVRTPHCRLEVHCYCAVKVSEALGMIYSSNSIREPHRTDAHFAKRLQMRRAPEHRSQAVQELCCLGAARCLVTAAETAAVRISVISRPSMKARGSPVSGRKSMIIAEWVGKFDPAFFGKEADQLGPHPRFCHRRHDTEKSLGFFDCEHVPHRLE